MTATPVKGDALVPLKDIVYPVLYALDLDEWKLIERGRQLKRAGNGEKLLWDSRTKTVQIVSGKVEKLS